MTCHDAPTGDIRHDLTKLLLQPFHTGFRDLRCNRGAEAKDERTCADGGLPIAPAIVAPTVDPTNMASPQAPTGREAHRLANPGTPSAREGQPKDLSATLTSGLPLAGHPASSRDILNARGKLRDSLARAAGSCAWHAL